MTHPVGDGIGLQVALVVSGGVAEHDPNGERTSREAALARDRAERLGPRGLRDIEPEVSITTPKVRSTTGTSGV